jgi:hypothetical protein
MKAYQERHITLLGRDIERIHATTMGLDTSDCLDGVGLNEQQRASAKEDLRNAEYVVDFILSVLARSAG